MRLFGSGVQDTGSINENLSGLKVRIVASPAIFITENRDQKPLRLLVPVFLLFDVRHITNEERNEEGSEIEHKT